MHRPVDNTDLDLNGSRVTARRFQPQGWVYEGDYLDAAERYKYPWPVPYPGEPKMEAYPLPSYYQIESEDRERLEWDPASASAAANAAAYNGGTYSSNSTSTINNTYGVSYSASTGSYSVPTSLMSGANGASGVPMAPNTGYSGYSVRAMTRPDDFVYFGPATGGVGYRKDNGLLEYQNEADLLPLLVERIPGQLPRFSTNPATGNNSSTANAANAAAGANSINTNTITANTAVPSTAIPITSYTHAGNIPSLTNANYSAVGNYSVGAYSGSALVTKPRLPRSGQYKVVRHSDSMKKMEDGWVCNARVLLGLVGLLLGEVNARPWSEFEALDGRRIIRIERQQDGCGITAHFRPIGNNSPLPPPPSGVEAVEVSCLRFVDHNMQPSYYITSVEVLKIVDLLTNYKETDRTKRRFERARIRSNLLLFWAKHFLEDPGVGPEEEELRRAFIQRIMYYRSRKPVDVLKDVRLMSWEYLVPALQRAILFFRVLIPDTLDRTNY